MKATIIIWNDDRHNRIYSLIFGDIVYHIEYNVKDDFEYDIGKLLTSILYQDIDENITQGEGGTELLEEFDPHEIIHKEEFDAVYLLSQELSQSIRKIYEQ